MKIETPNPNPNGPPIIKEVVVTGGVRVKLEGTRYSTEATVLSINEADQTAYVKGTGFTAEVGIAAIMDATDPTERTYQEIMETTVDSEATTFDSILSEDGA